MSFTFTKEGQELQWLLNNKNWGVLFSMLNYFRYMRNFSLESLQWLNLFMDMKDDFMSTLRNAEPLPKINLYNWFMRFLATYEEIKLTDIEIARIKKCIKEREE